MLVTPNSGEHADHMAPRLDAARNPITVSGMFGMSAATRSPFPTPSRRSRAATAPTLLCSSRYDTDDTAPDSDPAISAGWSSRLRRACSA